MNSEERFKIGISISKITIFINIILSALKLLAGILGRSGAMIADGIHSLSDVLSTIAVMVGLKLAKQPADEDHPYGHEKMEPIMAKILASILLITALLIGFNGIKSIIIGTTIIPGKIAIYAALLSILTKEWMYRYTLKGAKKIDSSALIADAWHHRSDAFSSIGTLVGIAGARMGYPILDPIASLVICIIITKVAIDIYKQAINQLVDHCADANTIKNIKNKIEETSGVINLDELKTRIHGNRLYVDVEICVDKNLSVCQAHDIAERVHNTTESLDNRIKHCTVHVNPNS
ncbi:cation diffusion facilitator family transporter [Clostridium lacusfryxellense]|uniref:cation diffusion facilitator family transporter n=1 Tax=Clostridium lacusfryxellense TaxID=205328 RepID=UPI001C0BB13B|nr:cation diffusion facilitator family transporter [Clostridium lacusfryxellense]MBU3114071.1 cation diffusion facilitator family transporter [Clostridium lacusfryxellense]